MIIAEEGKRLILNVWTRVAVNFTVRIKYKNEAQNNQYTIDIPVALADLTRRSYPITLIKGSILSVSVFSNTAKLYRGQTYIQCFYIDDNSFTPIDILFADYLTNATPIGFPFTGIKDNGADIENGFHLITQYIIPAGNASFTHIFQINAIIKLEAITIQTINDPGYAGMTLIDELKFSGDGGVGLVNIRIFPKITSPALVNYMIIRNSTSVSLLDSTLTKLIQMPEFPFFKSSNLGTPTYKLTFGGGVSIGNTNLNVVTKELINIES